MLYIIVLIFIIATISIGCIDRKNKNTLINKIADVDKEMKIWTSDKTYECLKNENFFLSDFCILQFEDRGIEIEKVKPLGKLEKKFFVPYDDIVKVEKLLDGNKYILNNGFETYDDYCLNVTYLNNNEMVTEKIYIEKSLDDDKTNPVSKIKYNTYLNILVQKLTEKSENLSLV